jgi:hypothetical protein
MEPTIDPTHEPRHVVTMALTHQAYLYLHRKKPGTKYGWGVVVSMLTAQAEERERIRETLERAALITREEWVQTGLCVD